MDQNTLTPQICSVCEGTGKVYNETCKNCFGSGYLASDANGTLYLVKKENDSLVVVGPKNQSSSNPQNNQTVKPVDGNFIKIVGNVLFALPLLALVYVDFVYFNFNTFINISIVILIFCCIVFNVITLPDRKVKSVRENVMGENEVHDLHWAIRQIKNLQNK